MKIVVSGSNGFIGHSLATTLHTNTKHQITGLQRKISRASFPSKIVSNLLDEKNIIDLLTGQDILIHCAGIAHKKRTSPACFENINTALTVSLASSAVKAGCRKFIFISSIGVNGKSTQNRPFLETDPPNPQDLYSKSKWEAEKKLWEIAAQTGLEVIVIRPPLVYGQGAPGNFGTLMKWISHGLPIPLGSIKHNRRSFIALENLVAFISICCEHPKAPGQTFLISDSNDISTAELIENLYKVLNKNSRLIMAPEYLIRMLAKFTNSSNICSKLMDNLEIDTSKAKNMLDWKPVVTMEEQLYKILQSK